MDNEPRLEQRKSPVDVVTKGLQGLFDGLKEHLGELSAEDYDNLSHRFTGEVDEYVMELIHKIQEVRSKRKGNRI